MSKKKKIIILSCMVLLLAATAVCNFLLSGNSNGKTVTTATYFSEYRSERTTSRSEAIVQLDSIIKDAESGSEAKEAALKSKLRLTEIVEEELKLESLIKAKGYKDIVVSMGTDNDIVNVIVEDDDFTTDDAIAIYTILLEQIKASPENVKIIPIS